uniref:Dymeclin n=1 Tax=Brassica oleracea var. oleracea TaxID=109376 RepID=A0A0D3E5J9_BRAOL
MGLVLEHEMVLCVEEGSKTTTTRSNFIDVSSVFALFLIFTITDSDYALVDSARLKEEETWEARGRRRETPAVVMMFSVAEYLITTFVGEKSFLLESDFWNKLLELPSSSRWPSDRVHQACELFELLRASDDDQASNYKKTVNAMYIASVFLKHLIENGKSDSLEELHLSLDESKPVPHGFVMDQNIQNFVMHSVLSFIGSTEVRYELLNFMIVAMSIQLLSGPSPGPRDANPFIDAEKSLVFLAVRRLLLNYTSRTPPNAKGYLYSDGDSPGILERVGSAAGRYVCMDAAGNFREAPGAGHIIVALERNYFVFGGLTDFLRIFKMIYLCLMLVCSCHGRRLSARSSKAGSFFFVGDCNKNLDPLDDIYYYAQLTDDGYDAQFDQTPGNLSLTKIMKLKCQERKLAERGCIDLGIPINSRWQFSRIEVEGTEKRHVMLDAKCDHREKTKKTLSKDSAGCSQQADTIDDAKKKVADTNDMYTNTVATADANINIARSHELYGMMMFLTIIHTEYAAFVFIL